MAALGIVGLLGCDPEKAQQQESGCEQTSGDSAAAVGIAIDCSFRYPGADNDVTFEANAAQLDIPVGGKLIADGALFDDPYDGRSFSLTIYAEDSSVLAHSLYQMDPTRLPVNEYFGDHGFTGLNSVKDPDAQETVQFACFARDPGDPPHAWED